MNKVYWIVAGIMVFALCARGGEASDVKRTVLPNGLVILTKPVTTNSIISAIVSLRMGSLYETDQHAGLTTLMQDTIRRGTTTRTSEQIALELEQMGTRLATTTNRDYGTIGIQSTKESLYPSLDILFDLMENAAFPEDAVALQKTLQIQNIMARYDQPIYLAMDLMVDAHYGSHPFHKPMMGYPERIETFTRDQLAALYRSVYVPNNMVITAVGNFDENQLIAVITDNLGALPRGGDLVPVVTGENTSADRTTIVEKIDHREGAASWFMLGWNAPKLGETDSYAMEVLDAITGGSMNSRLFIAIREKRGLAYQVASFYNARRETGIYVAYIGTQPSTYEESKRVLIEEVQRMGREAVTEEEITLAKSYLRGMNIMSQESNAGQASQYGHYEIVGIGYDYLETYPDRIGAVESDDILRIGSTHLRDNYALGAVLAGE
ncbi:M16 family metallopeptidase [Candidatus Latescibacterota bacterium]